MTFISYGEVYRTYIDNPEPDEINWSLREGTIIFDFGGGDTEEAKIIELDTGSLILEYYYEIDGEQKTDREILRKV